MLYWGLDEFTALAGIVLCFGGTYVAFDLIRISQGAPRAWYFVVAAFATLVVFQTVRFYFDIQIPDTLLDNLKAVILLAFDALLLSGLYLLDRSFRKHLKVVNQ